jgi:outer membrane protein OmpA-like peptidoglycan-associated protein
LTLLSSVALRARAQGLTLDQYRAAETPRDGFVVTRPRTLGHLDVSASLHVEYALEPLQAPAGVTGDTLIDHQLVGHVGGAIGLLDRFVVALRVPVVLLMEGAPSAPGDPGLRDPGASGAGMGDLALTFRAQLVGEEGDLFALALQTEATVPLAEAINATQDLAGEAGVSFTPELAAELRFAPVHVTANLGVRFREQARYQALAIEHELTWALAVGVDAIEDVLEISLEGFGATSFRAFPNANRSPVELLLGVRVRPVSQLYLGLAGGAGLGDAYGAPVFRGVFTIGYADIGPARTEEEGDDAETQDVAVVDELTPPIDAAVLAEEVTAYTEDLVMPLPETSEERVSPPEAGDYGLLDRDGDRIVDAEDQCVLDREDYDEVQDSDGCPEEDADADAVPDGVDVCPLTVGVATDDPVTNGCPARAHIERGAIVITSRVEFASGSDRILPASEAVLIDVLAILTSSPDVTRVRIEGHTDDRGSDRSNFRLSRARAASVLRWLQERGVEVERLEAWGCGEAHPLIPGATAEARQSNRRVEFLVVAPLSPDTVLREGCLEGTP